MIPPTLADLADHPELIDALPGGPLVAALSAQASALAYRLAMRAACAPMIVDEPRALVPEATDLQGAAKIIGLSSSTLATKARHDIAYRRLLVRTGTRRLLFPVEACREFVRRRPLVPGPVA